MSEKKNPKKQSPKANPADTKRIAQFLFEVGTMRKLLRMHRQMLLTDDMSDNIASHSYRVAVIGWHLAKLEGADPYKVVMMCLLHDMGEVRSGDHNWVHKRYVKVYEDEIKEDQIGTLPFGDLKEFLDEYDERMSKEAIVAKDADLLDQVLLLKEYEWLGNKEAGVWLKGKSSQNGKENRNAQLKNIRTAGALKLGEAILKENISDWWNNLWTNKNR